jgi:ABC-type transport system substrate-binding protein/DNA-binding SARP family transcriptional activator/sugar lactone lactonase YvrE
MAAMATVTSAQPENDIRIGILGPLEVHRGDAVCALGGRQQRAVLALLVLDEGRVVSVDRIADALWGDRLPASSTTTIQTYIFRLREVLEPGRGKGEPAHVLVSAPGGGYRLTLPHDALDAARFEAGVARGRAHLLAGDPSAAAEELGAALQLWRGDVLSDLGDLGPVSSTADRLDEERTAAVEDWAAAELELGHHASLAPHLASLEATHPLRERLAALRMVALYRSGRQADALTVYQDIRQRLDRELGVIPGEELRTLHERILRQDPELVRSPAADAPSRIPSLAALDHGTSTSVAAEPAVPTVTPGTTLASEQPARRTMPMSRRRRRWSLAVATAVLIASTLASMGITRSRDSDSPRPVPVNSAAVVGPNGLVGDAVAIGAVPIALAEDSGSVWVLDHTNGAVVRVDPHTRRVVQTIPDVGNDPQGIAARDGKVWVAVFGSRVVTRIDAETNKVVERVEVGNQPAAVLATESGVWVANSGDNTVQRIDLVSGKADRAIEVGDGPSALAMVESTLWVANARSGTVTVLNTRTGKREHADIVVDAGPSALAVTDTDVWVANQLGRTVSRIDRTSMEVARIFVDDGPGSVVVDGDGVWVGNSYAGTLSRIDARSNRVTSVRLGSSPRALALVENNLWTASGALTSTEHVGGTLVVEDYADFSATDVDPTSAYEPRLIAMMRVTYDGLVAFSRPGGLSGQTIVPDLATALPQPVDGGRTYVFTIRRGVRYSDGRELKARDFVLGFRRTFARAFNTGLFGAIIGAAECAQQAATSESPACPLPGVEANDDAMSLTIHLSEPDPELVYKLAYVVAPAPPGTPIGDVVAPKWIPSTGPYTIGSFGVDGTLTLVRNPYFSPWSQAAQPPGYPDVIVHHGFDDEHGTDDVLTGRADLATVPYQLHDLVVSHPAQTHEFDEASTHFLYVNTHLAPFDNVLARRALNFAVDRREFVRLYASGRQVAQAGCQLLPPGFPSYRRYCPYQTGPPDQPYRGPNLEEARRLVAQSGTYGARVTIHRKVEPADEPQNVWWPFPDYVAGVLRDLGYRVTVEDIPPEHRRYNMEDPAYEAYQLFTQFGWIADYNLPSTFYDHVVSCRQPNITRYCNKDIDAVAKDAFSLEASDPGAAVALWSRVDRMLVDDGAFVSLGHPVNTEIVSTRVGNYQARASYGAVLSQLWVQ